MSNRKTPGVKRNPAVTRVFARWSELLICPVLEVTQDGASAMRSLDTNLVCSPGFQVNFQPRISIAGMSQVVVQHGLSCLGGILGHDLRACYPRHLADIITPCAAIVFGSAFDKGPIRFLDGAAFELFSKTPRRPGMFGEHHDSRGRAIQTMGHAQIHTSGLRVARLQKLFDPLLEAVDVWRRLRQYAARFGHRQERAGFMEDFETGRRESPAAVVQRRHR